MKKFLLTVLASIGLSILIPAATMAAAYGTVIDGNVTNNGHPVKNALVTIVCDTHKKTVRTKANGSYSVLYSRIKNCEAGQTVQVSAVSGSLSGDNSGSVNYNETANLNISVVNVSIVPELGLVTGAGALLIGGGAFAVIRRRKLSEVNN